MNDVNPTVRGPQGNEAWFHGGVAGLNRGDELVPSPPHVNDGCPLCVARAAGIVVTVGQYRKWLLQFGERARPVLNALEGAADDEPMDPPSEQGGVYITTDRKYATWYAARSGNGDLYEVEPMGPLTISDTDHFHSAVAPKARVVRVLRRNVRLSRQERRAIDHRWRRADRKAQRRKERADA